jgi:hypothetical protein
MTMHARKLIDSARESGLRELYMLYRTKCVLLLPVLHSETFRSQILPKSCI